MNEEKPSGKVFDAKTLKRIFAFVKPYIHLFNWLVILTLLSGVLTPIRPYLIQKTIDEEIASGNFKGLIYMTIILIVLAFVQSLVQYYHTFYSNWLGQNVIRDIRTKLYKHVINFRLSFFDKTPNGRLVTRHISDIETLADIFSEGLAAIAGDLLQLVFLIAIMLYTDWRLTLVSLSTLPFLILATYIFKEKMKKAFSEVRAAVANLNTFVQEHITGMSIVQIFNSEERELAKFNKINKEHRTAHLKTVLYYSIYFPVAEVIAATGTGLLVWYGAREVLHNEVTAGVLIAFIMYISLFFRPIRTLADRFNTLQMGIVASDRILKLLDSHEEVSATGTFKAKTIKGDVLFKDVWFAYSGENYVLKNINFEVKAGETIAFVGATGAGKSSIINLLSRFYEINKGQIFLDGIDIQTFDLQNLRRHIGVVLQDVFLYSDSIRHNITLGNAEITNEQIWHAAELVGAKEFIEKLPNGLDYNVMERGATLSVGQRQLISFVRAMVYDPKIIVLDEATSSVDSETEQLIQKAIEKMMKGRTAIVIAHRLATIQKAHKIIVLDKGEIKEMGTHSELLERDGYYAHLHHIQYKEVV
ncbi:MAG: ABC transporter ATP-binding protein [Flammeovirgaceae bacterium]